MSSLRDLRDLRAVGAGAVAVATAAVLVLHPVPTLAAPADKPVHELLRDLRTLYAKTESASEAYHGTAAKLARQRHRTERTEKALSSVRATLAEARQEAGRLARQQYRTGDIGLPSEMQLLLADDPQRAMEGVHLVERAAGRQAVTLRRLTAGERRQRQLAVRARRALAEQQRLMTRQQRQRATVHARMHDVEGLLSSLSDDQLSRMRDLETAQFSSARQTSAVTNRPGGRKARRVPSRAGSRAVTYALRQIGKPYRYGANGPHAYDCSGLTSKAWGRAGRSIPRTSQGQWRQLPHVPLNALRPGDLIVYNRDATHVGIYAGKGKVVHAPRPGARVRLSPVGTQPVRGAVRPDAGARPLRGYRPPKLAG